MPSIVPEHEELLKRNYFFFLSEFPVNRKFLEGRHMACFSMIQLQLL